MPVKLATRETGFETAFRRLLEAKRESAADVDVVVAAIVEDVARRGDAALIDYTNRFDRVDLPVSGLRVPRREIAERAAMAPPETVAALRFAAERIESFHRRQLPPAIDYVDAVGVRLANRWRPISAAGLYVPGGTAAYPSSLLMNAIPAKVAGVARLVMTVPAPAGVLSPLVLAAAQLVGVDEVYRVGGAQAIAALAFGTATIAPVDKIIGPGNAYVAAAKRRVFGRVGIDMIAGPSEILVVADRRNDPQWIAADLMSQAEHDSAAQAILVTDDAAFAAATYAFPGPTILSTGAIVAVPKASAATACAPPTRYTSSIPTSSAAARTSGLRTPPGAGTVMTNRSTPATLAGIAFISTEDG